MEIERKFLLKKFPPLPTYEEYEVTQGYISIDPEVRIRKRWHWLGNPKAMSTAS